MSALPPFAELRRAAPGFAQRQAKTLRQARFGWAHPRRVGFVFGCQRSGTKLVMRVLDRAPDIRIFHENHASGFEDFKLRSDPVIRALIALNPAPVQVFKPICDSHEADHILQRFPDARGVWVVRNAADVANSAVKKWGDHQRQLVESLLAGDEARWGWRMARVPADARAEVAAAAAGAPLTDAEGALLFWYLRNRFFFSLGLDRDPRMRLIRYDALARDPEPQFAALFDHLGAPFDPACIDRVRGDSVGRAPAPAARPAIQALCDALTARFEAWTPAPLPLPSPVLLLIDSLSVGGAERYVVTVANWLDDHGVKVTVASGGGSLAAGLRPGVRQVEGELDGVRAGLPRAAWLIHKVLREGGHRAVICSSVATTLIARAAAPSGQAPIFNVAHGWPAAGYPRVGKALRAADRVVAVSGEVRQRLIAAGLPAKSVVVVQNGVDLTPLGPRAGAERDRLRAELGAGPDDVLALAVGRLEQQKAHQRVFSIAERLMASHPRLRFAVVGGGSRRAELEALRAASPAADRVRLTGARSDVAELLGVADIFFNCSDWEGMPLTTIEAMGSGLPVVCTRTEGADALLDEASGIVVPVGDAPALAAAIAALADDPDHRARMGAAAAARARARFSADRMARELMHQVGVFAR